MIEQHFVVIGNGPAGNQAALTLREKAPDARITLISRHQGGCYRPHLLPQLVSGKIEEEGLYVFSPSSYKDKGIKLRSGQEVVAINPDRREIVLDHKEVIPFHGLIIAVGGSPRIPEHLSAFKEHMLTLKTLKDARSWMEKLPEAASVLIIGGDLTSLAFTKALLTMEKKVYFALNEDAFWPLRFNDTLFEEVAHKLSQKGVKVLKHSRLKGVTGTPDGIEAQVGDETIRVGLIGAFFGLVPDIGFAARSGFKIDRGILVDEYLNTGVEGVFATGDCAQVYHPELRDYWVSIGHDNAVSLGRIAARNLVGERVQVEIARESIYDVQGVKVNTSWWTEF
jgi:NAD(P)H-nitrite reductase large subunit